MCRHGRRRCTSERTTEGHPDTIADQMSDAIGVIEPVSVLAEALRADAEI